MACLHTYKKTQETHEISRFVSLNVYFCCFNTKLTAPEINIVKKRLKKSSTEKKVIFFFSSFLQMLLFAQRH